MNMNNANEIAVIQTIANISPTIEALPTLDALPTIELLPTGQPTSDAELIAIAKDLNASVHVHLRKSVEFYWRLGEVLTQLHDRETVKGQWRKVLKEIGINPESANQARRLHAATSLAKLAEFKNKTAALRALRILSEDSPVKSEAADRSSKLKDQEAPAVAIESTAQDSTAGAEIEGHGKPLPSVEVLDPQTKITKIAASLEYLAADDIDVTVEFLAQIDRAIKALDSLRQKGTSRAAA